MRPHESFATRSLALGTAAAVAGAMIRRRSLRWGATRDELAQTLPGDELMARADLESTRVVTIGATPDQVWPWVAQLGQGRGGFYSYDFLENLVGSDIHSADTLVPEWQRVEVGDHVRLAPEVGLIVARVDPGRAMVLRGGIPMGPQAPPYDFTWAFVLQQARQPDGGTRLIVRERYSYIHRWAALIVEPIEMLSFLMSARMLLGIKRRAERAPQPAETAGSAWRAYGTRRRTVRPPSHTLPGPRSDRITRGRVATRSSPNDHSTSDPRSGTTGRR